VSKDFRRDLLEVLQPVFCGSGKHNENGSGRGGDPGSRRSGPHMEDLEQDVLETLWCGSQAPCRCGSLRRCDGARGAARARPVSTERREKHGRSLSEHV
jgi:hypothetical protein